MKYKYIEKIDGNHISTDIYTYNSEKNDYIKINTLKTTVTMENIIIEEGGNTTIEKNPFNTQLPVQQTLSGDESIITPFAEDEGNGNWVYQGTSYGSSKAGQWTLAGIAVTIASISRVPAAAKWIANMAALYYSFGKDIVYYRYETYKRGTSLLTETQVVKSYFSDSGRTNQLGANATVASRTGLTHLWSFTN